MADFTVWATACVPISYFTRGFLHSHNANRRSAIEDVVEADPVAARIRDIMAERAMWMFQLLRVAAPVRARRIFGRGRLSKIFPSACPPAPAVRRAQTPFERRVSRLPLVIAASELTVLTMPQAQVFVQIIACSRFGATPMIWTLESTLEASDEDPWGWLASEAE